MGEGQEQGVGLAAQALRRRLLQTTSPHPGCRARLHLAQLAATLARLGADRWAPLRAEYAGPIPYGAKDS